MARLEELERKFEENPRRYFAPLANEYRKAGDAQRAAELCRSQLPEVPGHISGHIVLGQALYDAGDFDGSRAALETALALDPENIVALRYLGDIARDTGDVVEAERWYSRMLEADPYNEVATTALQALREAPAGEPAAALSTAAVAGSTETAEAAPAEPEFRPLEEPVVSSEFGGDLAVSAASETTEPAPDEPLAAESATGAETAEAEVAAEGAAVDIAAAEAELAAEVAAADIAPVGATSAEIGPAEPFDVAAHAPPEPFDVAAHAPPEPFDVAAHAPPEPFDVAAHAPPEPGLIEEALEAEERVLESAAPFVTETMADLYMEQGYPHEALELLLQLAEQRPDEPLRAKIQHIESVIVARRDAAVAAARAERAETAEALAAIEPPAGAVEAGESAEPAAEAPLSIREMFARMDRARPRAAGAVTAPPISRRRPDFVPMPDTGESDAAADPFAFPNAPEPGPVPRTSGPQQTFNPSTADSEDFDAWLRGLKGS